MNTGSAAAPPKGIGGWLRLFAFLLCVGFVRGIAELAVAMPDYLAGFQVEAARGPLIVVGLVAFAGMAVHLWGIVSLFRQKRAFRTIFAIMSVLTLAAPFSILPMLMVPGVRLHMILAEADIARTIGALIAMALWYWYLCVSVRVKNTLVN
ncbi:MAG: DUF2569 family protein [Rhodospirillales bacterium]|nr:DUF2569 family protein [Rhodospirillales bacterium]